MKETDSNQDSGRLSDSVPAEITENPPPAEMVTEEPDKAEVPAPEDVSEKESTEEQAEVLAESKSIPTTQAADNETVTEDSQEVSADEAEASEEPVQTTVPAWKKLQEKIQNFFTVCGLPEFLLMRFIGVYMLFSGIHMRTLRFASDIQRNPIDEWREYVTGTSFISVVIWIMIGFALLTVIYAKLPKFRIFDQIALFGGTLFFGIIMMWKNNNFYNCMGMTAIAVVFSAYTMSRVNHKKMEEIPSWLTAVVPMGLAAAVCTFIAVTTVYHHKTFGTSTFDFGIFVQMFHSMSTDLTAVTTCERSKFLSHFNVHASFIYYILAPVYAVFHKPETLLVAQAILAMGGVIPFYFILKNHDFNGVPRIAACCMYIFCAGIMAPCYYDFHENAFLPTILMLYLYAVDRRNTLLFYIMSVLTCIVKEDAPLYVLCIAMYYFFNEKQFAKRIHAVIVFFLSGAYFVFVTDWLTKHGDGSMMAATRFGNLTIDSEAGFGGIIKNVLTDPAYFFSLFFTEESLMFFLQIMVPMAFLPFMTKKISRFLLMIPFVIMNLVVGAGYGYASRIGYQYIFGPSCLLLYMAVLNAQDIEKEKRNSFVFAAASASVLMLVTIISPSIGHYTHYMKNKERYERMEACLASIPEEGSVVSNTWYLPHIANRTEVYSFDNSLLSTDPDDETIKHVINPMKFDYYVISCNDESKVYYIPDLESAGFYLFNESPGDILIYASPSTR